MNFLQFLEVAKKGVLLDVKVLKLICAKAIEIIEKEANLVHVSSPVAVVGDTHGQFYDLLEIFAINGFVPDTNYLFLGDYVDRGHHSVETITLLLLMKICYPQRVILLRGNHESRSVTYVYGFYQECVKKFGNPEIWQSFCLVFDCMSISAMIDNEVFVVHGGIGPNVRQVDDLLVLNRFGEIPPEGPISDIMWSDPVQMDTQPGFCVSPRGAGYTFGVEVFNHFLHKNKISKVLRAHQLCMEGFQSLFNETLYTIWSAPNYCYRCGNKASVLNIFNQHFKVKYFDASPESKQPEKQKAPEYFL